jgi:hypothetical protein
MLQRIALWLVVFLWRRAEAVLEGFKVGDEGRSVS